MTDAIRDRHGKTIVQCMGGWCASRDSCRHYHAAAIPGRQPAERLCERGHDEPERIVQPRYWWIEKERELAQ